MSRVTDQRDKMYADAFAKNAADRTALLSIIGAGFHHWINREHEVRELVQKLCKEGEWAEKATLTLENNLRSFAAPWFENEEDRADRRERERATDSVTCEEREAAMERARARLTELKAMGAGVESAIADTSRGVHTPTEKGE